MPTILLKKSDTPGSVPGTANLTNLAGGVEVAVNTADKRMFSMTSASAVVELGTNPSSLTCADGSFVLLKAASASITNLTATSLVLSNLSIASANITTLTSSSATISTTLALSGGTANGVLYVNSTKVAASGSALTFDGANILTLFRSTATEAQEPTVSFSNKTFATQNPGVVKSSNGGLALDIQSPSDATFQERSRIYMNGGTSSTVNFQFSSNNGSTYSDRMTLTSTGLGIGTSSPAGKLHVNNTGIGQLVVAYNGTSVNYYDADTQVFRNGAATERMRLDTSGNLGLGVTPSAWSGKAIEVGNKGTAIWNLNQQNSSFTCNAYYDGAYKYGGTGSATSYQQAAGIHYWYTAASGTAGNAITFTQAMTLDASGNLVLGETSTSYRFQIGNGTTTGVIRAGTAFTSIDSGYQSAGVYGTAAAPALIIGGDDNTGIWHPASDVLAISTGGTERARITSGGYFKASNDGNYIGATGAYHEIRSTAAGTETLIVTSDNGSFTSIVGMFRANRNTTNGTFNALAYYNDAAGAYRFFVADSGNVTNTNGSYGTISDAKMKTDIVDAGSQWADLKAVRFRKFKMKDDPSGLMQLGVVAQELEQTSPGLVEEHPDRDGEGNDLGTTTKSVKTSVLLMKAAVALQEAMARIEKLEAEVAALKGA